MKSSLIVDIVAAAFLCFSIADRYVLSTTYKNNSPLNNHDYVCSSEIEVYGEMVQNTSEYMVFEHKEYLLPISTTYELTTYYVYKNTSIVCYKQEYTTEIEV